MSRGRSRGRRGRRGKMPKQALADENSRGKNIFSALFSEPQEENILRSVHLDHDTGCPLPISTRGIGFMVTRMMQKWRQAYQKREETIPDLSAIYRASLAQLQDKMFKSSVSPSHLAILPPSSQYESNYWTGNWHPSTISYRSRNLSGVALIINSIGKFEYREKIFTPVFLKELSPLNLKITNLREYRVKMADLETEASFRMSGYQLNSIPTAIWKRKNENDPYSIYLDNPDDIIPENYTSDLIYEDLRALDKWIDFCLRYNSFGTVVEIDFEADGNPSLLVSTHVTPGDTLRIENGLIEGDQKNFWSRDLINGDACAIGIAGLLGEVLSPTDSWQRSRIDGVKCPYSWNSTAAMVINRNLQMPRKLCSEESSDTTSRQISNLFIEMPISKEACPLTISTRCIGLILTQVTDTLRNSYPKIVTEVPLSAIYRASLAQLEAKIYFAQEKQLRPFSMNTIDEGYFEMEPLMTPEVATMIRRSPNNCRQIVFLINGVGHVNFHGMHFEPRFTKETSPLNLRITNLREYCVEMADPSTDSAKRVAGYDLNSIPNAKWARQCADDPNSIILTNPDDIIPPDYDVNRGLYKDLSSTYVFFQSIDDYICRKYASSKDRLGCRGRVDFYTNGDPGILVSTDVSPGQSVRLDENNRVLYGDNTRDVWSCGNLDRHSWYFGAISLVGEVSNSSIVSHRSLNLAARENFYEWGALSHILLYP